MNTSNFLKIFLASLLFTANAQAQLTNEKPLNTFLSSEEGAKKLNLLTRNSPETFNRVTLLDTGKDSLPARKKLIENAKNFIFITVPFWDNDPTASDILNSILVKKEAQPDFEFKTVLGWTTPIISKKGHRVTDRIPDSDKMLWNAPTWQRKFSFNLGGHEVHDKLFIADGDKLIMGGLNMTEDYLLGGSTELGWHDTDILIEGPAAQVATDIFLKVFTIGKYLKSSKNFSPFSTKHKGVLTDESDIKSLYNYFYLNKEDHDFRAMTITGQELAPGDVLLNNGQTLHRVHIPILDLLKSPKYHPEIRMTDAHSTSVRLIYDNPLFDRRLDTKKNEQFSKTKETIEFLLQNANESAWFFMPYLTTDESITKILAAAAKRLDVRIITNSAASNDMSSRTQKRAEANYEPLLRAGVKIYEFSGNDPLKLAAEKAGCKPYGYQWPGKTLHTKMILIDNAVTLIGSNNLDFRSLNKNNEITALINDAQFARKAKNIFDRQFNSLEKETVIECFNSERRVNLSIIKPPTLKKIELAPAKAN